VQQAVQRLRAVLIFHNNADNRNSCLHNVFLSPVFPAKK
jgi:hypothetical protein